MGMWKYGLTKDDYLVGAIKSIPEEGENFSYGNRNGKIVTLQNTIKDIVNNNNSNGEITLDNGETYHFYTI